MTIKHFAGDPSVIAGRMSEPNHAASTSRDTRMIRNILILAALAGGFWWIQESDKAAAREGHPDSCWTSSCTTEAFSVMARRL